MVVRATVPENLGKVGRIGKYIGELQLHAYGGYWEFDTLITYRGVFGDIFEKMAPEAILMRIDGMDLLKDADILEVLNDIKSQQKVSV